MVAVEWGKRFGSQQLATAANKRTQIEAHLMPITRHITCPRITLRATCLTFPASVPAKVRCQQLPSSPNLRALLVHVAPTTQGNYALPSRRIT